VIIFILIRSFNKMTGLKQSIVIYLLKF